MKTLDMTHIYEKQRRKEAEKELARQQRDELRSLDMCILRGTAHIHAVCVVHFWYAFSIRYTPAFPPYPLVS